MKILAIDHVQLAMPPGEEESARRFYRDVMGFVEIPKPDLLAGRGGAWFQQGAVTLTSWSGSELPSGAQGPPRLPSWKGSTSWSSACGIRLRGGHVPAAAGGVIVGHTFSIPLAIASS